MIFISRDGEFSQFDTLHHHSHISFFACCSPEAKEEPQQRQLHRKLCSQFHRLFLLKVWHLGMLNIVTTLRVCSEMLFIIILFCS